MKTKRQRIKEILERSYGVTPSSLAKRFEDNSVDKWEVIDHIKHLKKSLEHEDKEVLVAPPYCKKCEFEDFDDNLNVPSKCPNKDCRSEWIAEPRFKIE